MADDTQYNILVADQNSYWTRLLVNILPEEKYKILVADDGLRALQIVDSQPVDLMVCELNLPEILGGQLVKMVRARQDKRNFPIIVYTNQPQEEWDRECVDHCQAVLVKYETDVSELADMIKKYLK